MQTRTLPGTDLSLSLLGFGNFVFGTNWWGDFSDDDAIRLQNHAVDLGVNFFDTAPAYGNGRAEALMKPTIAYAARESLVISTKFGYDLRTDPGDEGSHRERRQDFSRDFIIQDCEESLQRMEIDTIDLYQSHNLKLPGFDDEMLEAMEALKKSGKIRAWGVALGPAIGWREEGRLALDEWGADAVQTVMNLYEQDPGREMCELAESLGRGGIISRVPTNSGILDEEFASADHVFPPQDHRKFRDRDWLIYGLQKNEIVRPFAERVGSTLRQFAFRWLASQPAMVSIEPNILGEADLDDYAAACEGGELPDDVLKELSSLYDDDFGLGNAAHPCDLKSSTAEGGRERSGYRGTEHV